MKACLYFCMHEKLHPSSAHAWNTGIPVMFRYSFCFVLNPCTRQQNKIRLSLLNLVQKKLNFVNSVPGEHANYIVIISWKEEM